MKYILTLITLVFVISQASFAQKIKEEEKTFKMDKDGYVSIDTYKGSIDVETWDKAEVFVHVKIEPDTDGWSDTSPEEQLDNVKIKYDASDNAVRIRSKYDKADNFFGSSTRAYVHYKIKMPKTAQLDIDDYKSEIRIQDLQSSVDLETYKGRVDIFDLSGDIDLETYKGDVSVDFDALKKDSKFETFKGSIKLSLSSDSKFDLDLDLGKRGDFDCDFDYSTNGRRYDDDIRGSVNGGGPRIEFETYKGDLSIIKK